MNVQKINYQKELDKILKRLEEEGRVPTLLIHSCCASNPKGRDAWASSRSARSIGASSDSTSRRARWGTVQQLCAGIFIPLFQDHGALL